jgi:hypothetical protein
VIAVSDAAALLAIRDTLLDGTGVCHALLRLRGRYSGKSQIHQRDHNDDC